jgi:hypothetical protein
MGGINESSKYSAQKLNFTNSPSASFKPEDQYKIESAHPEYVAQGVESGVKSGMQNFMQFALPAIQKKFGPKDSTPESTATPTTPTESLKEPNLSQPIPEVTPVTDKFSEQDTNFLKEFLDYLHLNRKQ